MGCGTSKSTEVVETQTNKAKNKQEPIKNEENKPKNEETKPKNKTEENKPKNEEIPKNEQKPAEINQENGKQDVKVDEEEEEASLTLNLKNRMPAKNKNLE